MDVFQNQDNRNQGRDAPRNTRNATEHTHHDKEKHYCEGLFPTPVLQFVT